MQQSPQGPTAINTTQTPLWLSWVFLWRSRGGFFSGWCPNFTWTWVTSRRLVWTPFQGELFINNLPKRPQLWLSSACWSVQPAPLIYPSRQVTHTLTYITLSWGDTEHEKAYKLAEFKLFSPWSDLGLVISTQESSCKIFNDITQLMGITYGIPHMFIFSWKNFWLVQFVN